MTSFADTFTRADSASALGNGWTALIGTWGITSNAAYNPSADATVEGALAYQDVSESDGTLQLTVPASFNAEDYRHPAIAFRVSDTSNYWIAGVYVVPGTHALRAFMNKIVAGVDTGVGSQPEYAEGVLTYPMVLQVVLAGASIDLRINSTSVLTASDGFNQTATKHGLNIFSSATITLDDFSFTGVSGTGLLLLERR